MLSRPLARRVVAPRLGQLPNHFKGQFVLLSRCTGGLGHAVNPALSSSQNSRPTTAKCCTAWWYPGRCLGCGHPRGLTAKSTPPRRQSPVH